MSNNGHNIEKANFDAFINAVGSEIQQAQVRLIVAANAQMLFHYWKMGNYILYHLRYYCYFLYAYLLKDSSYRLVSCAVKRSVYYLQTAVCYEVSMYTPAVLPCQDTCR